MGHRQEGTPTPYSSRLLPPRAHGRVCIQRGPDFLETVQFRAIRAERPAAEFVKNPWHSRRKVRIVVTPRLMMVVHNLTPGGSL